MLFIQLVSNRLKSSDVSWDNLCGQKPCCIGDIDGAGVRGSECVSEDCLAPWTFFRRICRRTVVALCGFDGECSVCSHCQTSSYTDSKTTLRNAPPHEWRVCRWRKKELDKQNRCHHHHWDPLSHLQHLHCCSWEFDKTAQNPKMLASLFSNRLSSRLRAFSGTSGVEIFDHICHRRTLFCQHHLGRRSSHCCCTDQRQETRERSSRSRGLASLRQGHRVEDPGRGKHSKILAGQSFPPSLDLWSLFIGFHWGTEATL